MRPCICDRHLPGQPFERGRDCGRCWLWHNSPTHRSLWEGAVSPSPLVSHDEPVHPGMCWRTLAGMIEGPEPAKGWPKGWARWDVTRKAHRLRVVEQVTHPPIYPEGRYSGRGVVICGGGKYWPGAYVAARMLRQTGWGGPIQIWHRGHAEPVQPELVRPYDVECVDAHAVREKHPCRILRGWESKSYAVLHCPFEEVLYLDADAYPVADLTPCFEALNERGAIFWPDNANTDANLDWSAHEMRSDNGPGINGGHWMVRKRSVWAELNLMYWMNQHSDYYYAQGVDRGRRWSHGYGDQDTQRLAWAAHRRQFTMFASRPIWDRIAFVQIGPDHRPLFVHRCQSKLEVPKHHTRLPREREVLRLFGSFLQNAHAD